MEYVGVCRVSLPGQSNKMLYILVLFDFGLFIINYYVRNI
jgi:hypothetical protein